MRLTLNYIVTVISAFTHSCDTNPLFHLQLRQNTFVATLKSKTFPFRHKRNFNPKVIVYIIFHKSVCRYVIIAFFQILYQKPRYSQIFLLFFLQILKCSLDFLTDVILLWQFSCLKKANTATFYFSVLPHKNKCF